MNKKIIGVSLGAVSLLAVSALLVFPKTTVTSANAGKAPSSAVQKTTATSKAKTPKEKSGERLLRQFPTWEAFQEHFGPQNTTFEGKSYITPMTDETLFYPDVEEGEQSGWLRSTGHPLEDQVGVDKQTGKKYVNARAVDALTYKEIKALYNR